ncbi:MAG TPA: GGDEF domain-containing protein [Micromonosporaceae bacterium]|nr:GGDEF domain-containing protein [Micromonosporaceae bacterium]HCU51981.1 GGDEF domain-containing protein [Micromonosporaceae bacterium]
MATVPAGADNKPREELATRLDAAEDNLEMGCDADEAHAIAVKIEAAAEAIGAADLSMRARMLQADMSERMGQPAAVAQVLWEVNRWASEHDSQSLLARSHLLLARTYFHLGDMAVYLDHAVCAVEALESSAPSHTRAYHLMKLADALKWNGSMDAARERYRQAERIAAAGGPVELLMMVLNNLAYGEYMAGEPQRSWSAIERLLGVAAAHDIQLSPAKVDTIARAQIALGRYVEAEQTIQAGMRDYEVRGHAHTAGRAEQLLTLAVCQRFLGEIDRAQATLDSCHAVCEAGGHGGIALRVQQEQAELYAAAADFRAAFEAHKTFHAENEKLRSLQREAHARARQAMFETTEARQDAERFREQARRDPLTGLHNRRYADEQLPGLISHATATGSPLSIGMIDVDHFKRINDTHSHHVGDKVLISIANLLSELTTAAKAEFVARIGGEEFLIVLPGMTLADAVAHLDHARTTISSYPWQPLTADLPVTVSIGVASTEVLNGNSSALLADADRNLYAAKRAGRNQVAK